MIPQRDRLVVLSFTTAPYQNNSIQDENYYKSYRRPSHDTNDNDDDGGDHLIEKVHSMVFDDNDYFDTHEKLENERTTAMVTTLPPITSSIKETHESHKVYPTAIYNQQPTEAIPIVDSPNIPYSISTTTNNNNNNNNGGNRKQNQKMRNRPSNSSPSNAGRPANRKNSSSNRERVKEGKSSRRGDDARETSDFANGKANPKKYSKLEMVDDLQPDNEFETSTTNRKSSIVRDSNIHIVKSADANYLPSTPYSTDSKIIEIKPSSMRANKRNKRSNNGDGDEEMIETRMRIETDADDEFADISDEVLREPRIYVNLDSVEHYSDSEERALKPTMMSDAYAAALIDTIPVNVTTAPSKQLHGLAGCLQHYLNVDKEIGN